ncbi:MAG: calcium/sodium antiporter [Nitriliruptor sp.]
MSLPLALLALVVGLVILVRAADTFVAGAEAIAVHRRWSPAVIGAVIVGFGTSLPELVTSVIAAFGGQPDLALGNAAGSNVANLLLILGVAALVSPIVGTRDQAPRRDGLIAGVASVLLLGVAFDGRIGAVEGGVLVLALLAAIVWQVRTARSGDVATELPLAVPERFVGVRVVGGLLGVLVGAQLLVAGATDLAERAGLPEIVIGSLLVAVGTSLPELATAIASARRGQVEILLGNLLGSNAFNALMVVGASALVGAGRGDGFPVDGAALAVVAAAAVITGLAALILSRRPVITRPVGAALVALHVASVPVLLAIS